MEQAASSRLMRRLNRSAILNLIRTQSPIARTEIARRLKMSLPTVMRVVNELLEDDLVCFEGSEPSGGRRRPLLKFNGSAYAVLGIDLGGSHMYGTVTDLMGRIQHEITVPANAYGGPTAVLETLYTLVQNLLAAPLPPQQRIRGIGIGAPGVTLSDTGSVVWAPAFGWHNLPLKQLLTAKFSLPTFVENDVNLAALGEYAFGAAAGASNLVCIAIGTGIGAGIILEGKLYRGHHQAAGEVGYFLPGLEYLGRRYDEFGALEYLASGRAVEQRARQLRNGSQPDGAPSLTAEEIYAMARRGETWAVQLVDETVKYLSLMVAGIASLLDPEVIVLSGGLAQSSDLLVEPIKQCLDGAVPYVPRIVASDLGSRAVVMGAIMLVLDATTGHVVIDQRV